MVFLDLMILLWAAFFGTEGLTSVREIMGRQGGSVWIPCHYDVKYRDSEKIFFKKNFWGTHIILIGTGSVGTASVRMAINDDKALGIFSITMRSLEKSDEGYYWCGVKTKQQQETFYLYLKVNAGDYGLSINSDSNVFKGQEKGSVSVSCKYKYKQHVTNMKYWCRGREKDSCEKIKTSNSRGSLSRRVSITDDTTHQVFTVTMSRLDRTDSGWYWCALQKGGGDEKVPVYIRVTPEPQPQPEPEPIPSEGSSPLQSTVATVSASTNQSKAGAISSCSNETLTQTPDTRSKPEERSDSMTIVLVISGLLIVLLLAAVIFTLRMKRNMEENKNQKRNTQPSEFRRHEATKEKPCGEIQYADISFLWETKEDTKPSRDPEDGVIYSVVSLQRSQNHQCFDS